MIICSNCFCDLEIKNRIESHARSGSCPTCGKTSAKIYDTDEDDYLNGIFDKIISLYTPRAILPAHYPVSKQSLIKDELSTNWRIFNGLDPAKIYDIIKSLSFDIYISSPELFDDLVANTKIDDSDYLKRNSMLKEYSWDSFVEALKHENRFHTNHMNTDIFRVFCTYIRKSYKKGARFYRGRISSESGFSPDKMGAPPKDRVMDGRANSMGISRLYLADNIETVFHEVRAGAFDYITIGCFELKEDITVVDLKMINQISPFIEELDALQYFVNREHLNRINDEMGKAMRRSDSLLDYIPTQYITDFIQSIAHDGKTEYNGVEYKSTMYPSGFNIAIFNPLLFECISTEVYKIEDISYNRIKI